MTARSLLGIHHITAITGDAASNVDFYARVLGLRLVKKTVNYDAPDVYHLYFGAETGEPGSVLTFFEFPAAPRGAAGAGMIHRISFDVASQAALAYWKARLADASVATSQGQGFLRFRDPEDLELELMVDEYAPSEFAAVAPDIPPENRLRGFRGVSAYSALPAASQPLLSVLGFARRSGDAYVIGSANRIASYAYSPPADVQPKQGAGTVHHIAWACPDQDQPDWRRALVEGTMLIGFVRSPVAVVISSIDRSGQPEIDSWVPLRTTAAAGRLVSDDDRRNRQRAGSPRLARRSGDQDAAEPRRVAVTAPAATTARCSAAIPGPIRSGGRRPNQSTSAAPGRGVT